MISAFYILNYRGEILISSKFRDDIPSRAWDLFRVNIISQRGYNVPYPVNKFEKYHYCHLSVSEGLWFVAVAVSNINVLLCFEFLKRFKNIVFSFCGEFSELAVEKKSVGLTEILEEICDHGYPQVTDANILKTCITQTAVKTKKKNIKGPITTQVTGSITWRAPNIKHPNHEVFITVLEKVNLVVSSTGYPLSVSVDGQVNLKTSLSGMPECKCGINDKFLMNAMGDRARHSDKVSVALEDYSFHQCVRLSTFEDSQSINFIPPDGKFELMRYRTSNDINIPFRIIPLIKDTSKSSQEITIVLKSTFSPSTCARDIEMIIPVAHNVTNANTTVVRGKATFRKSENALFWKIKRMYGGKEFRLMSNVQVAAIENSRATKQTGCHPIQLQFETPFSCSGMRIRYIKVFEPKLNYSDKNVTKWVRYISTGGKYEFRV